MNKKLAKLWIERAIEFSKKPDGNLYIWLVDTAAKNGIYCNVSGTHGERYVRYCAQSIAGIVKDMVEKKEAMVRPLRTVFHYTTEPLDDPDIQLVKDTPQIATLYFDDIEKADEYDAGLASAMMQIMAQAGIRSFGICEAEYCENVTFSTRRKPKKSCSNRCDQKMFRDSLSKEEKKEIHEDRVQRRRGLKEVSAQQKEEE